jgi:hypothetical protein
MTFLGVKNSQVLLEQDCLNMDRSPAQKHDDVDA